MVETENYYALLGIPDTASAEEIKRAYTRKRREFQNDEQKTVLLNAAYAALSNEAERKNYDIARRYGARIGELKDTINASEDQEVLRNCFLELKRIYEDILRQDAANLDAVVNLCNIADAFENTGELFSYLSQIERYAQNLEGSGDALDCWKFISKKYEKYGRLEEAARALEHVCRADPDDMEDVVCLARLFYERQDNPKAALSILNESISRTGRSAAKMQYLCESLRAIHAGKKGAGTRTEAALYEKMESVVLEVRGENNQAALNALAHKLLLCMDDFLAERDVSVFRQLERIYSRCSPADEKLNRFFGAFQQAAKALEAGKIHRAVSLLMRGRLNPDVLKQIAYCLADDAAGVKASIEYVKKNCPVYFETLQEGLLEAFEEKVDRSLDSSRELNNMKNDSSISMDLKEAFECFIVATVMNDQDTWNRGCELANDYLRRMERTDRKGFEKLLGRLEVFYPKSYRTLSEIFFEGKSTDELFASPLSRVQPERTASPARENTASAGQAQTQRAPEPSPAKGKPKTPWWAYAGYIFGILWVLEALESGSLPLLGIAILFGMYQLVKWYRQNRPEDREAQKAQKRAALRARLEPLKKNGPKLAAAVLVCVVGIAVLKQLPALFDRLQEGKEPDRALPSFSAEVPEDSGEIPNETYSAFPDGDRSKTPVIYMDGPILSWESKKELAAEQRPALMEYLGCGEDNLWFTDVEFTQGEQYQAAFWYVDDYEEISEYPIILLEDGSAAWCDTSDLWNYIYNNQYTDDAFIVNTIERNAFRGAQTSGGALNARSLSEAEQRARIAEYMGYDTEVLSIYGINEAGRMEFQDYSDNLIPLVFLLDDGSVAGHTDGEPPRRLVGTRNALSKYAISAQRVIIEEYFGCNEGHIWYKWSTDITDGDIRPLFEHTAMGTESYFYLADDFSVRQLVDYERETTVPVGREHFHERREDMISPALYAVLSGETGFWDYGDAGEEFSHTYAEYKYLDGYQYYDRSDEYFPLSFQYYSIIDMDGDGANEVVLGYDGLRVILHEYDGEVYGHCVTPGKSDIYITKHGYFLRWEFYVKEQDHHYIDRMEFQGDECRYIDVAVLDSWGEDGTYTWDGSLLAQYGFEDYEERPKTHTDFSYEYIQQFGPA